MDVKRCISAAVISAIMISELVFFGGNGFGRTLLFLLVIPLYYLIFGVKKGSKKDVLTHYILVALIIFFAIPFSITDSLWIKTINFLILLFLCAVLFLDGACKKRLIDREGGIVFGELLLGWFARPFACIAEGFLDIGKILSRKNDGIKNTGNSLAGAPLQRIDAVLPQQNSVNQPEVNEQSPLTSLPYQPDQQFGNKKNIFLQILLGLVIGCPVIIILLLVLAQADPFFAGFVENVISYIVHINVWQWIVHVIVGIIVFPFSLSVIWSYKRPWFVFKKQMQSKGEKAVEHKHLVIPDVMAITIFICVDLLYLFYAVVQLIYLFGAWYGNLPNGISHAEYARTGFFELSFLSFLNVIIIGVCVLFTKRTQVTGLFLRVLSVIMIILSFTQLFSAVSRMFLYIEKYGLTRMRFFVLCFLFVLGVFFVFLLIKEFTKSFPMIKTMVVVVSVFMLFISYSMPDAIIARYNIAQYKSGRNYELDLNYLTANLSVDSILVVQSELDSLANISDVEIYEKRIDREADKMPRSWKSENISRILFRANIK